MFAIDWVQLRDGFPFTGNGSRNEQYPYFGTDVLAVADGTVVFVRDDMPEETLISCRSMCKSPSTTPATRWSSRSVQISGRYTHTYRRGAPACGWASG